MQKAVVDRLRTDCGVLAALGAPNVFDTPSTDVYPRVTLGADQVIIDRADCYAGEDLNFDIHVWSQAVGYSQAKRICAAIQEALDEAELSLPGFRLIDLVVESLQFMRDPDGRTSHGVLSVRALTEPV